VLQAAKETWLAVDQALRRGGRGLSPGSSLARLLEKYRGARNRSAPPPLSIAQILAWADAQHARTGRWPTRAAGPVLGVAHENWKAIDACLRVGCRGLPGGSSLPRLLATARNARAAVVRPPLSIPQLLAWADEHHARTGRWPTSGTGLVLGVAQENWTAINASLRAGNRGLPGGSSLARLLAKHRNVPNRAQRPPLTMAKILAWAKRHRELTGRWPSKNSGPVAGSPSENWRPIDHCLRYGRRGLPEGSSLAKVVEKLRGGG
jgi:hypothetical protein